MRGKEINIDEREGREILGEKFITMKAVAAMFGCTRQTVGRIIARGELTATKVGRDWLIKPESVKDYLDEKTRIGNATLGN